MRKLKNLFIRIRNLVRFCKKTTDDLDSVLEDINESRWNNNPTYIPHTGK